MICRRNNTLEMLKLFAAYMVVFLHVPFYGAFGAAVNALARFAVPFFFLVSGFFSYGITTDKIKRRIGHVVFLLVFAILLCTACNVLLALITQGPRGIVEFVRQYLSCEKILKLLLLNKTIQVEYLWYLLAILYVYILFYFATVLRVREKLYWVITLSALGLHLMLGEILSIFGIVIPNYYLRNFALTGVPFFGLGMMANKYKYKLAAIPSYVILILIAAGMLENLLSWYFFGLNEVYIGSVCILFALVIVFVKFPNIKFPENLMALAGCNAYIYILHPILSGILIEMFSMLGIRDGTAAYIPLRMIHPLIVCTLSTLLAYGLNIILPRVEEKIKHGGAA